MTAYYNDNDPYVVEHLKNMIVCGFIEDGEVDSRSIQEVQVSDLKGFDRHHFFAGIGGWDYALQLANWPWDRPVWSASLPCQPFSVAGKGRGEKDERHLWPYFKNLVENYRPAIIIGEQVAAKDGRQWLSNIRLDLEALEYGFGAADLCVAGAGEEATVLYYEHARCSACDQNWEYCKCPTPRLENYFDYGEKIVLGAPHIRQRLYWIAEQSAENRPRRNVLDVSTSDWLCHPTRHRQPTKSDKTRGVKRNVKENREQLSERNSTVSRRVNSDRSRRISRQSAPSSARHRRSVKPNGRISRISHPRHQRGRPLKFRPQQRHKGKRYVLPQRQAGHIKVIGCSKIGGAEHTRGERLERHVRHGARRNQSGRYDPKPCRSTSPASRFSRVYNTTGDRTGCRQSAPESNQNKPENRIPGQTGTSDARVRPFMLSCESADEQPWSYSEFIFCADNKARPIEPGLEPLADGFPGRVENLRSLGNAISPQTAASFIEAYLEVDQ